MLLFRRPGVIRARVPERCERMGSLIKKRRKKIRKHKLKKRRRANRHKKRERYKV
jgi:hypothetical protein